MPIANVRVPAGAFDPAAKAAIVAELTDAIADAEQIPDDPVRRARIIVVWTELALGSIHANGVEVPDVVVPVLIDLQPPAGALDDEHLAAFVAEVERIFATAAPAEGRLVTTSVIVQHVVDGTWGIGGRVQRLADFARTAGYQHLQHLVA